jgi:hypothetical protein
MGLVEVTLVLDDALLFLTIRLTQVITTLIGLGFSGPSEARVRRQGASPLIGGRCPAGAWQMASVSHVRQKEPLTATR